MILACELRTDKNFTLEEIQSGTLKDFLKPEDYDLEKRVSNLLTYFSLGNVVCFWSVDSL